MKLLKVCAVVCFATAFTYTTLATSSTMTDKAEGRATNIVETNNVIHVYTYTGVSSEAAFLSTFDQGETWPEPTQTPLVERRNSFRIAPVQSQGPSRYSRSNRSSAIPEESSYIKAIDSCVESGKRWNFRYETCAEKY